MMTEEEYQSKLQVLDENIKELEEEKQKIYNKISALITEKDDLKNKYGLIRLKNKTDTSEWIEKEFEWSDNLLKLLREKFKFKEFRLKQLAAINATLSKKDVLLLMPTGGGKSLVYQLPALIDKGLTLVVSPLISLIEDQLMALKKLEIGAATINSISTKEEKKWVLDAMSKENHKLNLLYVTPEWVAKSKVFMTYLQKSFEKGHLKRIVIDEVHCCSTWGHDFRPEYNYLGFFKTLFPTVPILGLTATATMNILIDIQNMLNLRDSLIITAPFNRPNLDYKVMKKPSDKPTCLNFLVKILKARYKGRSGIIYASTVKECEDLARSLRENGLKVKAYHAQLEPERKKKVHERWLNDTYQAVVATIAFGMGIDKPDVRFVIHYSMPKSMEGLYQESGRAGRDGKNAECLVLFSLSDFLKNVTMASSKTEVENAMAVLNYTLEQKKCRRALIAEHFEDTWRKTDCDQMCDNCKDPELASDYVISTALSEIFSLIKVAGENETKLTLNKLVSAWFKFGPKELRIESLRTPRCNREQAEYIVGYLISKGYLKIDKGFTMYTTVAYIQKGKEYDNQSKIIMPYVGSLGYPRITVKSVITLLNSDDAIEELKNKKIDENVITVVISDDAVEEPQNKKINGKVITVVSSDESIEEPQNKKIHGKVITVVSSDESIEEPQNKKIDENVITVVSLEDAIEESQNKKIDENVITVVSSEDAIEESLDENVITVVSSEDAIEESLDENVITVVSSEDAIEEPKSKKMNKNKRTIGGNVITVVSSEDAIEEPQNKIDENIDN